MLSKIAEYDPIRKVFLDQFARGLREYDLPSVSGGADPSRTMDIKTYILFLRSGRFTGVEPHPYPRVPTVRPLVIAEGSLGCDCCRDGISRPLKYKEKTLSLILVNGSTH